MAVGWWCGGGVVVWGWGRRWQWGGGVGVRWWCGGVAMGWWCGGGAAGGNF